MLRVGRWRIREGSARPWTAFNASDTDKIKEQLARGVPVIFGMRWSRKMGDLKGDRVLDEDDTPGDGHAMVAVGYDDAKRGFLIQNSFGPAWGDRGFGWFGYDFWKRNIGRNPAFVIE
jgi:C1A family cysteine protease